VAELVDALASGASGRKAVEVRVLSWAPAFFAASDFPKPLIPQFRIGDRASNVPIRAKSNAGAWPVR
jgi:hypothetical protein